MSATERLCERLAREIAGYRFNPRWVVRYTPTDREHIYGRELDALIAERVMGWRTHKIAEAVWYMPSESNSITKEKWRPSTDIAAAMRVVEKMRERGISFEASYTKWSDGNWRWGVEFQSDDHTQDGNHYGTSLPESICRAALKATSELSTTGVK